jgi:hypothetical protein
VFVLVLVALQIETTRRNIVVVIVVRLGAVGSAGHVHLAECEMNTESVLTGIGPGAMGAVNSIGTAGTAEADDIGNVISLALWVR